MPPAIFGYSVLEILENIERRKLSESYMHLRELVEQDMAVELIEHRQRPAPELLAAIESGNYGTYNKIWYALQGRTTIEEAGIFLLRRLRSPADYLVRYQCAVLLLSLYNPLPDVFTPVKMNGGKRHDTDQHINDYERALRSLAY